MTKRPVNAGRFVMERKRVVALCDMQLLVMRVEWYPLDGLATVNIEGALYQ